MTTFILFVYAQMDAQLGDLRSSITKEACRALAILAVQVHRSPNPIHAANTNGYSEPPSAKATAGLRYVVMISWPFVFIGDSALVASRCCCLAFDYSANSLGLILNQFTHSSITLSSLQCGVRELPRFPLASFVKAPRVEDPDHVLYGRMGPEDLSSFSVEQCLKYNFSCDRGCECE